MTKCECCDHPLEHAIREAVSDYENGTRKASTILYELRETAEDWKAAQ